MIFAAASAPAVTAVSTYGATSTALCSPAMISQRDTLDAQVKYDLEKVQAALATDKAYFYSTTFMRFATNTRTLARINGGIDGCAVDLRMALMQPTSYATTRKATYQDLMLAEFKLNELWMARRYSEWLRQLRYAAGLHRTLAKLDTIIKRLAALSAAPPPSPPPPPPLPLPNNGSGFTTNPQDDHHEVDDGYSPTPATDPSAPVGPTPATMSPSSGGGGGSSQLEPQETEPPAFVEPIWKHRWFWPTVGIAAAITGTGLLLRRH
jgi:hypothetical protein